MSNVYQLTQKPTKRNTVLEPEQVIVRPIYAQKGALAQMLGVSKSTIYRLMKEAERDGVEEVFINVTSTLTLIHIDNFVAWLKSTHKKYL